MDSKSLNPAMDRAIRAVGVKTLAEALGITTAALGQWKNGVRPVPAERCPQIERATNGAVKCEELRPDIDWAVIRERA